MARGVPARADGLPQRQARRPGRFDRADARLVQARQRPQLQRRDLRSVPAARREVPPRVGAGPSGAPPRPAWRRRRSAAFRAPPERCGRRARSRCRDRMPSRRCAPGGCGSTSVTLPRHEAAVRSDTAGERIVTVRLTSPPRSRGPR
jgi:hypothetical protein